MDDYKLEDGTPAEFEDVAAALRANRAAATPLQLDQIKLRAMEQAGRTAHPGLLVRQKGKLMKSRLALMMVIATGLLMGTGGATLAITGSSGSGDAGQSQYQQPGGGGGDQTLGNDPGTDSGDPVEATDQLAAAGTDSGELAFTGYVTIPLIVFGVGLLVLGLVLRHRLSRDEP